MSVYLSTTTKGEVFVQARADIVTSLEAFREALIGEGTVPNITGAYPDHAVTAAITPYATVGLVRADFENYGAGNATYDMQTRMTCQVFVHTSVAPAIYDEQQKWDLLNSLYNYYKNLKRISANFDGLIIVNMEGDVAFPETGTIGAVFNFQLWKVVST